MPKKKLTKAQVKRKYKAATNALYDLYLDKLGHGNNSFVTQSNKVLVDIYTRIQAAMLRIK
tara:strand:+ start:817 stop:999 length:183 start_codon:yes stop_codon:yes gene_type:complete